MLVAVAAGRCCLPGSTELRENTWVDREINTHVGHLEVHACTMKKGEVSLPWAYMLGV